MKATVEGINQLIRNAPEDFKKGQVSDGYHTFDELYEHRIKLWLTVCEMVEKLSEQGISNAEVWKTLKYSGGSIVSGGGWFLVGITNYDVGEHEIGEHQLTYHLPISYWDKCSFNELERAPEFDGHTSQDVLERLKYL